MKYILISAYLLAPASLVLAVCMAICTKDHLPNFTRMILSHAGAILIITLICDQFFKIGDAKFGSHRLLFAYLIVLWTFISAANINYILSRIMKIGLEYNIKSQIISLISISLCVFIFYSIKKSSEFWILAWVFPCIIWFAIAYPLARLSRRNQP